MNTIVAEALDEIATRLEKAQDIHRETTAIIRDTMKEHGRIIFNGNNYSDEWVKKLRGGDFQILVLLWKRLKLLQTRNLLICLKNIKYFQK